MRDGSGKLRYMVTAEFIDPGPLLAPEQLGRMLEEQIFPSLEALAKYEATGRIAGGVAVGERRVCFVAEVANNDELDRLIHELPFWGLCRWQTTPLQGFRPRLAEDRKLFDRIRNTVHH